MPSSNSILSDIGWDSGFAIPIANAENKQFEDLVHNQEQELLQKKRELETLSYKATNAAENLKNVQQEIKHTQNLFSARKREHETENHMKMIAERERGRLVQEAKRLEKETAETKEKNNSHENEIFTKLQRIEEYKKQMNWDHQSLEAWMEESAKRDDDAMTLEKYTRIDESKIKELTLRIERLTDEANLKKRDLDKEHVETISAQVELDKTAEEFRKAHQHRQELILQWETTVEQMQRRDKDIEDLNNQIIKMRARLSQEQDNLREKRTFLENEQNNNSEAEKRLNLLDREAGKLRVDLQERETMRVQLQDELAAVKRTVDRTAQDLDATRAEIKNLTNTIKKKTAQLERAEEDRELLRKKLEALNSDTITVEERARQRNQMLSDEEVRQKRVQQELVKLRDNAFKSQQQLAEARTEEKRLNAEITGTMSTLRNRNTELNRLDQEVLKQEEILYHQDFSIQNLERRVGRMQGEKTNEEVMVLETNIRELNETLDEKNQTKQLLETQIKKLDDDKRRMKKELDKIKDENANLTSKIEELELHNEVSQKDLNRLIREKQDKSVDENIFKLELKRLREMLNARADQVYTLEKRKLQLETAMKDRRLAIRDHGDMLRAQLKTAEEERSTISVEMHERIAKIEKLRKRYEILMISMAPPEGEEEHSQAYYVIKAAQDKEDMQRTGDELDAKIRKAEKELKALENTINLMNGRNTTYKSSFKGVKESSEDMQEKEALEEQLRAAMDKLKYKKRQLREIEEDLQVMQSNLQALEAEEGEFAAMVQQHEAGLKQLMAEIEEQKKKIERVEIMVVKYSKDVRKGKSPSDMTPEEKDIMLRELRDFNKNIIKQLNEIALQFPQIKPMIEMSFEHFNIPSTPSSASGASSKMSSVRSSMSGSIASSRDSRRSTALGVIQPTVIELDRLSSDGDKRASSGASRSSKASSVASKASTDRRSSSRGSKPSSRLT